MVTKPLTEMKDKQGLKMQSFHDVQWTGVRRPQTAIWRIPKTDTRREKYSKSAKEPICSYETQVVCVSAYTVYIDPMRVRTGLDWPTWISGNRLACSGATGTLALCWATVLLAIL